MTGFLLIVGLLGLLWVDERVSAFLESTQSPLPWFTGGARGLVLAATVILGVAPILGVELADMLRRMGIAAPTWITVAAAMAGAYLLRVVPSASSPQQAGALIATTVWGLICVSVILHARHRKVEGVVAATGGTLLSFAYLGMLLGVWLMVRDHVGVWVLLGAMLTVKSSDSGAYFTGMTIGRHKLIPWLSPGKTWEGLAGGVVAAAVVGALLSNWSYSLPDERDHVPVMLGMIGGAVLGLVSPFGDLVESLIKRAAGVKDSGSILPGMGGALDVLDSPLLAGPAVYWLLLWR
jgi:phosphatidate cytidylyltransferase